MQSSNLWRCGFGFSAAAALLTACGGPSISGLIAGNNNAKEQMSAHKRTFVSLPVC